MVEAPAPHRGTLQVVLLSTYELGHQPIGLASPARWLGDEGARVRCQDLAVEDLDEVAIVTADLVAVHVPMHTATRLAVPLIRQIRAMNRHAHICVYGLYAPMNEVFFRELGVGTVVGGEFEAGLVALYRRLLSGETPETQPEPVISLQRLGLLVPDRDGLPPLERYAQLQVGSERRLIGHTEASRGCKHRCRHCPIVPVYDGQVRLVPHNVVMDDIRQQVQAGATHISFGDPDFFNAAAHSLRIVHALHEQFPTVTYDVVIKVEHLVKNLHRLPLLRDTGCLFVTSAVEAIDDAILERLAKGHTRADVETVVSGFRKAGLILSPTFVAFTPWTTTSGYIEMLRAVADLGLVDSVAPIQYAIRLLIPAGSRLLDLDGMRDLVEEFDPEALMHPWRHLDPAVDRLQREVAELVSELGDAADRRDTFLAILAEACEAAGTTVPPPVFGERVSSIPLVTEPWYCCAEPTDHQFARLGAGQLPV